MTKRGKIGAAALVAGCTLLAAGSASADDERDKHNNNPPPPAHVVPAPQRAPVNPGPPHQAGQPPAGQPAPNQANRGQGYQPQPGQGAPAYRQGGNPGGYAQGRPPMDQHQVWRREPYTFHAREYGQFSPEERQRWASGVWRQEEHYGRFGWWWFVGGAWYFYAEPIYPYPGVVSETYYAAPPDYVDPDDGYAPPPPVVYAPPAVVVQPVDPGAAAGAAIGGIIGGILGGAMERR